MNSFNVINGSCVEQNVDVIVNAANRMLMSGGGICGAIFRSAGYIELNNACKQYKVPLNDGDAVITPAFNIKNAQYIIHAVGPNFRNTPNAFEELYKAYYNSLIVMKEKDLHSIAFPLISSGIFGGNLDNPVLESTKQCKKAYDKFLERFPNYKIKVFLCAYTKEEYDVSLKYIEKE